MMQQDLIALLGTINRVNRSLAEADDLHTIFATIRQELLSLIEATGISLLLLTEDGTGLEWVYAYEYGAEVDVRGITTPIEQGFSGHVARTNEVLLVNEQMEAQVAAFNAVSVGPLPSAWLGVPLIVANETIGVIGIEHGHNPAAFAGGDVQLLTMIAGPLATAINNWQRLETIQANRATAEQLYLAGRQITAAREVETVYQALIDFVAGAGLADLAFVMRPLPQARDYMMAANLWSRIRIALKPEEARLHRDAFPSTEQLLQNQVVIVENGQTDPRLDSRTRQLFVEYDMRAAAFIPIHVEGQWQATLVLNRVEAKPPTEQALQPLLTLCDQAVVVISNLQLLQETSGLYRISRTLNQTLTVEDALQTIAVEVANHTGVPHVHIFLYEQQEQAYRLVATHPPANEADAWLWPVPKTALRERFLRERRPLLVRADDVAYEMAHLYLEHFQLKAALFVPVASQQALFGMLTLAAPGSERQFTRSHLNFVQSAAAQLTTFLENIDLFEEALARARELITLNQIGSRLSSILDLEQLVRVIHEEIDKLFDATVFLLAAYSPESNTFSPLLHVIAEQEVTGAMRSLSRESPLYEFLQRGEVVQGEAATRLAVTTGIAGNQVPCSGIWVPLQQEGRPIGLLSIHSTQVTQYSDTDAQLLRGIATQTGLALSNARLFAETEANVAELRELDRVKTQFLATMSHELRTPLNSIIGFSRVILKGIDGPITSQQEEDLTSIYHSGQHLLLLINDILDLAKIEAGKMALVLEKVDLAEMADNLLATTRSLVKDKPVELVWMVEEGLPSLEADPVRLRQILINLLSNAAKYTESGTIRLQITAADEEHVCLQVADSGIGVAPEDYDKLFVSFEQINGGTTQAIEGTGLGLPITQSLVQMHQGQIWFESEVGAGTTFFVRLPLTQQPGGEADEPGGQ